MTIIHVVDHDGDSHRSTRQASISQQLALKKLEVLAISGAVLCEVPAIRDAPMVAIGSDLTDLFTRRFTSRMVLQVVAVRAIVAGCEGSRCIRCDSACRTRPRPGSALLDELRRPVPM